MQTHDSRALPLLATVAAQQHLTMSSREIAELCGKEHKNVIRDIRSMLNGLKTEPVVFSGTYTDAKGEKRECFNLPKRETLVLVSGYSVELRAKIIDRWMELEGGAKSQPTVDFSDPRLLLGVLSHLQGEVARKDEIIAEQGGRLKKLDRIESAKGSMCVTDAAKTLGIKRDDLYAFMSARRWVFKRAGNKNWLAYDAVRHAGLMEHSDHLYIDKEGRERVSTQALVTAKGLVKLAGLLEQPLH